MDDDAAIKKTLGRRKIEIKKIEKKTSLQVTFTKRRMGLFRKASELSVLCGAEIAILVKSPAERIFAFGHPSVETLIDRFQRGIALSPETGTSSNGQTVGGEDGIRSKYEESVRRLEMERRVLKEKESSGGEGREFWFDEPLEGMELHELEEYVEALEELRDNVLRRVEEIEKRRPSALATTASSSNQLANSLNQDDDQGFGFGFDFPAAGLPIEFNDQDFHGGIRSSVDEGLKVESADDDHPLILDSTASGYYI
ncbi:agamous-like MADS-box protein AGL23 [Sesamum indicum]|uniref:Agamous-like MADS-box protein AGL23 n=1 Tax=Sesamum indicum TaxID=4182 RepID=A0A6I9UF30_SESIN|nr:agamous-like MADS-box protein AGL23 [Sesamum indicum]